MIKFGKLRLTLDESIDYQGGVLHTSDIVIVNVCEKTQNNFTEILINEESRNYEKTFDGNVVDSSINSSNTYDIYISKTLDQIISLRGYPTTKEWITPLEEV